MLNHLPHDARGGLGLNRQQNMDMSATGVSQKFSDEN